MASGSVTGSWSSWSSGVAMGKEIHERSERSFSNQLLRGVWQVRMLWDSSMKHLLILLAALSLSSSLAADGPLRHMVAFKFKAGAEPAKIKAVEDAFAALKGKIDVIQQIEAGTDISPDKRNK